MGFYCVWRNDVDSSVVIGHSTVARTCSRTVQMRHTYLSVSMRRSSRLEQFAPVTWRCLDQQQRQFQRNHYGRRRRRRRRRQSSSHIDRSVSHYRGPNCRVGPSHGIPGSYTVQSLTLSEAQLGQYASRPTRRYQNQSNSLVGCSVWRGTVVVVVPSSSGREEKNLQSRPPGGFCLDAVRRGQDTQTSPDDGMCCASTAKKKTNYAETQRNAPQPFLRETLFLVARSTALHDRRRQPESQLKNDRSFYKQVTLVDRAGPTTT